MAKGLKTSAETRAAVMAALLAGQGVMEVAQQLNVSPATVSRIKAQIDPVELKELERRQQRDFGALLGAYLEETIITLREQAIFFRDIRWLRKQAASEVAVLHGVCADKTIRLLEAIERSREIEEETTKAEEPDLPPVHSESESSVQILQAQ